MPFKEGVFIYSLLVFGMVCSWDSLSKTRIYRKDTLSYSIRLWRSVTVPKNPVQNYFTCDITIFSKYLSISWQLQIYLMTKFSIILKSQQILLLFLYKIDVFCPTKFLRRLILIFKHVYWRRTRFASELQASGCILSKSC